MLNEKKVAGLAKLYNQGHMVGDEFTWPFIQAIIYDEMKDVPKCILHIPATLFAKMSEHLDCFQENDFTDPNQWRRNIETQEEVQARLRKQYELHFALVREYINEKS